LETPAKPHVVLSADQLDSVSAVRVAAACAGWATFERVAQDFPAPELAELLNRTEIVVGWVPANLLRPSAVSTYLCGSAGYDAYVAVGLDKKPDFRLTNAAGIMTIPIAEHCLTLMLALTRQLPVIIDQQRRKHYERRWDAGEVFGTTACIVGLGGVGNELAKRCRALGMRTLGVCRDPSRHAGAVDVLFSDRELKSAVAEADHVFAVLPGGPATKHLFNADVFRSMKRGARFYTASRGSVTDEAALIEALVSGHLGGAGVDVFAREPLSPESPLWEMGNVIVSPHSAGLSSRLNGRLADLFVENLQRIQAGTSLVNEISPDRLG